MLPELLGTPPLAGYFMMDLVESPVPRYRLPVASTATLPAFVMVAKTVLAAPPVITPPLALNL